MEYGGVSERSGSAGTGDDLPPSHQNRYPRGGSRAGGNGMPGMLGNAALPRVHSDMESQIHQMELEAYFAILRAFKAQSDDISWEKEDLMTELRKELRVLDDEHRMVLSKVNADGIDQQISGNSQLGRFSTSQTVHDRVPSPTVSASFKKQKTTKQNSLSTGPPSSSALIGEPHSRSKNSKSKPYLSDGSWRIAAANRVSLGASTANKPSETANVNPLVGKKVWIRWPEDNSFYEAVIKGYNHVKGLHLLHGIKSINTDCKSLEWVNLKEIAPEDIRWEGAYPRRGICSGPGPAIKKEAVRGRAVGSIGRGRGTITKKAFQSSENGSGKKPLGDIEILDTKVLITELKKVFSLSNRGHIEIEKVKKVLKDHEEALENAIAQLEDASGGESGSS